LNCIARPPAILIVDDEPDMLAVLDYFVHRLAPTYDIVTVSDAHSALSQLAHRSVPLLIVDYLMPGMNGLQLIAAAKAASPTTYVILATGSPAAELGHPGTDQQVDTFLLKRDIPEQLADVVQRVLRTTAAGGSGQLVQLAQQRYTAAGAPYGATAPALLRWVEERLTPALSESPWGKGS
jgi:two-component system, response regulator, stage 0 sporulation protein F